MQRVAPQFTPQDLHFMKLALNEASRYSGRCVHPNPFVGAVLVSQNIVISTGAHQQFGQAHAEINALNKVKNIPNDATLYVTLEPCSHFGKTPPCVDEIIKRGIKKVVIAMKDTNPKVSGEGIKRLKNAGVEVVCGALEKDAVILNKAFSYWIKHKMPYVTVKLAQSLDGCIATKTKKSQWISCAESRDFGQVLRQSADAILVGIGTVLADDPRLTLRLPSATKQPLSVILDSTLKISRKAQIFKAKSPDEIILFVSDKVAASKQKEFSKLARVVAIKSGRKERLDWKQILTNLGERGVAHALIEGGSSVFADALAAKIVNEMYLFIAPILIGGKTAVHSVGGEGVESLKNAYRFKRWSSKTIGCDILFHGEF